MNDTTLTATASFRLLRLVATRRQAILTTPAYPKDSTPCLQTGWPWLLIASLLAGSGCSSSDDSPATPPDDPLVSTINTGNYQPLIEFLFTIANAEILDPLRDSVDTIYGDDIDGVPENLDFLTETSSQYDPDAAVVRYEYACRDGGTYAFMNPGSAVGGGSGSFDECHFDGTIMDGSFGRYHTLVKYVYSPGWDTSINYSDLSMLTEPDAITRSIDASLDYFAGQNENTEQWTVTQFIERRSDAETRISDAQTRLYSGDQPDNPDYTQGWMRSLSTRFTVIAPQTAGKLITVITEQDFIARSRADTYTSGVLQVSAEDGSEMQLIADNGDPKTFQVDISENGTLSSFTLPWEAELRLRCLASPDDTEALAGTCR